MAPGREAEVYATTLTNLEICEIIESRISSRGRQHELFHRSSTHSSPASLLFQRVFIESLRNDFRSFCQCVDAHFEDSRAVLEECQPCQHSLVPEQNSCSNIRHRFPENKASRQRRYVQSELGYSINTDIFQVLLATLITER